jgi:hypothetical protein
MTLNKLDRAQKVRATLFARYDQLNALWQRAEAELTRNHIPRPVHFEYYHYPLDPDQPDREQVCECLGLQKINGKWRLCHGVYVAGSWGSEPSDWKPMIESSGEDRVRAAEHLPAFRDAVIDSAERFVEEVDRAIKAMSDALGVPTNLPDLLAERAKLNGKVE